jgi:plasmid stabilization system protein ParE
VYSVKLSPAAYEDIAEAKAYIAERLQNPSAAENTAHMILSRIRTLQDFPKAGSPLSPKVGFETSYRYLLCGNYLVFYRVDQMNVFVDRVLYGRRDYARILFGDLLESESMDERME